VRCRALRSAPFRARDSVYTKEQSSTRSFSPHHHPLILLRRLFFAASRQQHLPQVTPARHASVVLCLICPTATATAAVAATVDAAATATATVVVAFRRPRPVLVDQELRSCTAPAAIVIGNPALGSPLSVVDMILLEAETSQRARLSPARRESCRYRESGAVLCKYCFLRRFERLSALKH
jgi:hypothetical protein